MSLEKKITIIPFFSKSPNVSLLLQSKNSFPYFFLFFYFVSSFCKENSSPSPARYAGGKSLSPHLHKGQIRWAWYDTLLYLYVRIQKITDPFSGICSFIRCTPAGTSPSPLCCAPDWVSHSFCAAGFGPTAPPSAARSESLLKSPDSSDTSRAKSS